MARVTKKVNKFLLFTGNSRAKLHQDSKDNGNQMNDSADMKIARADLDSALDRMEAAAKPILSKMAQLERTTRDSDSFREDRSRLAEELDQSKSELESLAAAAAAREAQFQALADESKGELSHIIAQVRAALEGS